MIGKAAVITPEQAKTVLTIIKAGANPERNRLIFLFTYLVGLRVHNLQKLTFNDCYDSNFKPREVIVLNKNKNKGNRVAEYYVCEKMQKELEEYMKWVKSVRSHINGDDYLMWSKKTYSCLHKCSIVRLFRSIYDRANLEKARSHSGRRSFINQKLQKGVAIQVVSKLVNHSSLSITMGYVDFNPDMLKNAVNVF